MTVKRSTRSVSKETYTAILALDKALRREFSADTAYSIVGNGETLAASNLKQGRILPTCARLTKEEKREERIRCSY